MIKKIQSMILTLLLCLSMTDITYAEQNALPALELYLTQDGYEGNSLLAVLTDYELAADEAIWADVYWSLDNKTFYKRSELEAEAWSQDGKKIQRPCMQRSQEPLASYLKGEIDQIYVKMEVFSTLGGSVFTQVACLKRPAEGENVQMIQTAGPGILPNMLAGSRFERYAMFHMTVTESEDGYETVLPATQPVGLSLVPEQSLPYGDRMSTLEMPYGVAWEQTEEDSFKFMATEMWNLSDEDYYFVAGNQNFCLKAEQFAGNPLTHEWMAAFKWYCTVHPVPKGYETEIILEEDAFNGILSARLPLKPTGMTRIEVETSVDGGQNWNTTGILHAEDHPVDYMPSMEDYSISILSDELVNGLLAHGQGTFMVRLKIVNGALGNQCELEGSDGDTYTYSKAAVWTGEYTELPDDGVTGDGSSGDVGGNDGTTDDETPDDGSNDNAGGNDGTTDDETPDDGSNDNAGGNDGTTDNETPDDGSNDNAGGNDGTTDDETPDDGNNDKNEFQPGNDENNTEGSGGNNGNVGSDNDGETNGQRPGIGDTGNDNKPDDIEKPEDSENPEENQPEDSETPEENQPEDSEKPEENQPEDSEKPEENKPEDSENPEENKPSDSENSEDNKPSDSEKPEDNKPSDSETPEDNKPNDSEKPEDGDPDDNSETEQKPHTSEKPSENDSDVTTGTDNNQSDDDSRKKAVTTATATIGILGLACAGGAVLLRSEPFKKIIKKMRR